MTTTTTFFAAIESESTLSGAVYGIGATENEALADARYGARDSQFRIVPCTPAAYAYVADRGGSPSPALTVSTRGVSLRSEE